MKRIVDFNVTYVVAVMLRDWLTIHGEEACGRPVPEHVAALTALIEDLQEFDP